LEYSQKLGGILKLSGNRIVRTRLLCGVGRGREKLPLTLPDCVPGTAHVLKSESNVSCNKTFDKS